MQYVIVKSYMRSFDYYSNMQHTKLNILDVIYKNHLSKNFYQANIFRLVHNLLP